MLLKCLTRCRGCCGPVPQRYYIVIMAALGLSFVYILRNSFSLALTQMTVKINATRIELHVCPKSEVKKDDPKEHAGEFEWNAHQKQYVISAYFYGYLIAHVPGGLFGDLFGAKVVLNTGLLMGGIVSLLSPALARFTAVGYWALFVGRFFMGLGHGVIIPSLSSLVAKWAKPTERSLMSAITYSGITLGSAGGISLAGLVLGELPGWEPPFYIFGAMMLLWNTIFFITCFSSPADHPFISDAEKNGVEEAIKSTARKKPKHIPWCKIICSLPVLSMNMINFGHAWLVFFVGVQLPIYLKDVLHFDIKASGVSGGLPYMGMWFFGIGTGVVSDMIIKRKILNVTNTRKLFAVLSNFLPVPFFIGASYAGCDKVLSTVLFTLMMSFKGLAYSSLKANAIDLSPNYAGLIMGLVNGTSAIGGLALPYIMALFIDKQGGDVQQWRTVFFFSCGILVLLTLPFAFFASGYEQSWNSVPEEDEDPPPLPQRP